MAEYRSGDSGPPGGFLYDPKDYPDSAELEQMRAIVFPMPIAGMSKVDETHTLRAVHILRANHRKAQVPHWLTWLIFKHKILEPASKLLQTEEARRDWRAMESRLKQLVEEN